MTLLELIQRIIAFFLLLSSVKLCGIALSISTWGLEGWVYGVVAILIARVLLDLARYPFRRQGGEQQLWIW